ncbi:MAG: glycerophosphodiester phosphodiesterase [Lachnospiraceae bacterium]
MKKKKTGGVFALLFLVSAAVFASCSRQEMQTDMDKESNTDFVLEAHRGLSERYPQNTMAAFQAAAKDEQFGAIETDVQETKDGILVLFHDSTLDKLTNGTGKVMDYTYEELRLLRYDNTNGLNLAPDEEIPTLQEYLAICRDSGKIPYIELKKLSREGMQTLLKILQEEDYDAESGRTCILTTQNEEYVPMLRELDSTYTLEYMVSEQDSYQIEDVIQYLKQYENMVFRPNAYVVTPEDVVQCNQNGIRVESFGLKVGDKEKLAELIAMGVEGVTCNDSEGLFTK